MSTLKFGLLEFVFALVLLTLFLGLAWLTDRFTHIPYWQALAGGTAGWMAAHQAVDWAENIRFHREHPDDEKEDA